MAARPVGRLFVLFPLYWLVITSVKLPIDVNAGPVFLPWIDFTPEPARLAKPVRHRLRRHAKAYLNSIIVASFPTALCMTIG